MFAINASLKPRKLDSAYFTLEVGTFLESLAQAIFYFYRKIPHNLITDEDMQPFTVLIRKFISFKHEHAYIVVQDRY